MIKKSFSQFSEEDIQENKLPELSPLRKGLMSQRRVLFSLILINEEDKTFANMMMKEIAMTLSLYISLLYPKYEKIWNSELNTFPIIKEKWNYTDHENSESVKTLKETGFNKWIEELFLHILAQLESDETYFAKFFSNEHQKFNSESDEIFNFMSELYKDLNKKLEEFFLKLNKISPFIILILDTRVLNINFEDKTKMKAYSREFFKKLLVSFGSVRETFLKQFTNYFENYDVETRHCGVLSISKNFSVHTIFCIF